jgi:L-threonylcarbamoyladenylate synthase
LRRQGRQVGQLTSGGNPEQMARDLFYLLRIWDMQHVDVILCELPPPAGLGLAVRDRLLRAAGLEAAP